MSTPYPLTLETPRLILHLADPNNEEDCNRIIQIYIDPYASRGGNARVGINTIADVRAKHAAYKPRKELCTKINCEMDRMYHLAYLKNETGQQGDLIGFIGMSFRPELQHPDLGYALLGPYWEKGYATEGGAAVLRFWREKIGIEQVWVGTLDGNRKSQRVAEKLGFVRGGNFDVKFRSGGESDSCVRAVAYVQEGATWWRDVVIKGTVGEETEEQRNDALRME